MAFIGTTPRTEYEQDVIANADHWTAARGRVRSNRTVERFESLADARAYAQKMGDGRTMIYAVDANGMSAHVENA